MLCIQSVSGCKCSSLFAPVLLHSASCPIRMCVVLLYNCSTDWCCKFNQLPNSSKPLLHVMFHSCGSILSSDLLLSLWNRVHLFMCHDAPVFKSHRKHLYTNNCTYIGHISIMFLVKIRGCPVFKCCMWSRNYIYVYCKFALFCITNCTKK